MPCYNFTGTTQNDIAMESVDTTTNTVIKQTEDTTYTTLDHCNAGTTQPTDNVDTITYSTIGDYNKVDKLQPQGDAAVPSTSPDVQDYSITSGFYSTVARKNGEKVIVKPHT